MPKSFMISSFSDSRKSKWRGASAITAGWLESTDFRDWISAESICCSSWARMRSHSSSVTLDFRFVGLKEGKGSEDANAGDVGGLIVVWVLYHLS